MQTDLSPEMLEHAKNVFSNFMDSQYRKYQAETIRWVCEQDRKIRVLCAPTGSGKSLCGMAVGALYGGCTYLCSSKALQSQIVDDYPEAKCLMGRNNYPCIANQNLTAAECMHSKRTPCRMKHECVYEIEKQVVLHSRYKILNYSYFLFEANYIGRFSGQELVVCDEGDTIEGQLSKFISVNVAKKTIEEYKMGMPKYKTAEAKKGVSSWQEWGREFMKKVGEKIGKLEYEVSEWEHVNSDWQVSKIRQLGHIRRLHSKLIMFCDHVDAEWLMEVREHSNFVQFYPTWIVEELADKFFWQHAETFLLMSATFSPVPVLAKLLGLKPGDIAYREVPSTFPIQNRRVVVCPVANLTYNTFDSEAPKIADKVEEILMKHIAEKGIIHCVNYKLAKFLMDNVNTGRLITHDTKNRSEVLSRFKNSKEPLVLVSPSYERGISLDDDMGRFAIWAKAPYAPLGDKQVNKRLYGSKLGSQWYKTDAAQSIVQGCGRICRSMTDFGITYIIDSQIVDLISKHTSYFSKDFRDALEFE